MDPLKAHDICNQHEHAPSNRTEQVKLITFAYGPKIKGQFVDDMNAKQLYALCCGIIEQAYDTSRRISLEDVSRRHTALSGIDHSTLLAWNEIIEREASLDDDEQSLTAYDKSLVLEELAARDDWLENLALYE